MADEKRRFYGVGSYKGMTKKMFFEAVRALVVDGEDLDDTTIAFVGDACDYELETIELSAEKAKAKAANSPAGDALHSEYANALRAAIVPMITGNPQTLQELSDKAAKAGKVAPSTGKAFSIPWIGRVLNAEAGIVKTQVVVDTVDKNGLKVQKQVNAYKRG